MRVRRGAGSPPAEAPLPTTRSAGPRSAAPAGTSAENDINVILPAKPSSTQGYAQVSSVQAPCRRRLKLDGCDARKVNTHDDRRVITLEDWALIRRLAGEGVPK